jgi:ribonuclease HII
LLKDHHISGIFEAGCDEAGRGCLAGPVFAAAVILPEGYRNARLNDSKKLSPKVRQQLRSEIEKFAVSWGVAWVDNDRIDEINILRASIMAMHLALDKLSLKPDHIIIDGNRFYSYKNIPYSCIIRGDSTYASIAAASVLAKTYRDDHMITLHASYDRYGWDRNKGYPTAYHRFALEKYGITPFHRKSFTLFRHQTELNFH